MQAFLVVLFVFFGIFTQSASGFGLALVSMPLLTQLLGIQVATPLVALIGITAEVVLVIHYRQDLEIRSLWRLIIASLAGVPLGVIALGRVEEDIVLAVLGLVLVGYSLYALLNFRLPELVHNGWAYGLGFLAGVLGGAYNISGPPVVIYGHCRRWPPAQFKGNMQGYFAVVSSFVLLGHALDGNLTLLVWRNFIWSLVGIVLGIALGVRLDRYIDQSRFRRIVLVLLSVLGLRLLLL